MPSFSSEQLLDAGIALAKRLGHSVVLPAHILIGLSSDGTTIRENAIADAKSNLKKLTVDYRTPTVSPGVAEICKQAETLDSNAAVELLISNIDEDFGVVAQKAEVNHSAPTIEPAPAAATQRIEVNTNFQSIASNLKERVKGQDHAVDSVIKRLAVFMRELDVRPERPNGVFLFAGPTGVGKTEMARGLAQELYGSEDSLIRIDMSEYYHPAEIGRLTGSAPGYIGYDQPEGWITTRISKMPQCVLLLDEVEKAAPMVWNTFLQVFDAGVLTDGRGLTARFKDVVIIMTTNIGAEKFETRNPIGLTTSDYTVNEESAVRNEIKEWFRPELINRIDETIVFKPLSTEIVSNIAQQQLIKAHERLKNSGYEFELGQDLIDLVSKLGYDRQYGARPLLRAIEENVLAPLALQEPGKFSYSIEGQTLHWKSDGESQVTETLL